MKIKPSSFAIALIAVTLSACGGATTATTANTASNSSSTTQRVPATTSTTETTSTTSSTTSTSLASVSTTAIHRCYSSQITISEGQSGAGLGHSSVVILFTNKSQQACSLHGYPGVAGLNSQGQQVTQAQRTLRGYLGGLPIGNNVIPTLTLDPGDTVSAMMEGTDNPVGTATTCPRLYGLEVTAPNTRVSQRLPHAPGFCSTLAVHPVVPGTTGSMTT